MDEDKQEGEKRNVPHKLKWIPKEQRSSLFARLRAMLQTHGYPAKGDNCRVWKCASGTSQNSGKFIVQRGSQGRPECVPSFCTNENFNQKTLQSLDGFMIILSTDGVIVFVDANIFVLLGHLPADIMGRKLLSLLPDEEKCEVYQKMTLNLPMLNSVGNHIEFCCHLQRGNFEQGGSPASEYVKFILNVRDVSNDPFVHCSGFVPRCTASNLWEDRFYLAGMVCIIRTQMPQELCIADESSEVPLTSNSSEECLSGEGRSVQSLRSCSRMGTVHAETTATAALTDQVDIVKIQQYGTQKPVQIIRVEFDSSHDSLVSSLEAMPESPATLSTHRFEYESEEPEVDPRFKQDPIDLEYPVDPQFLIDPEDFMDQEEPLKQEIPVVLEDKEDSVGSENWEKLMKQESPVDSEDTEDSMDIVIQNKPVDQGSPVDSEVVEDSIGTMTRVEPMEQEVPVELEDMEGSVYLIVQKLPIKQEGPVDSEDTENPVYTVINEEPMRQEGPVNSEDIQDSICMSIKEETIKQEDPVDSEDTEVSICLVIKKEAIKQEGPLDSEDVKDSICMMIKEESIKQEGPVNSEDIQDSICMSIKEETIKQEDPVDSEDAEVSICTVIKNEPIKQEGPLHSEDMKDSTCIMIKEVSTKRAGPVDSEDTEVSIFMVVKEKPINQEGPVDSEDVEDSICMVIKEKPVEQDGPVYSEDTEYSVYTVIQEESIKQGVPVNLENTKDSVEMVIQDKPMTQGVPVDSVDTEESINIKIQDEPMKQEGSMDLEDTEDCIDSMIQDEPMNWGSPVDSEESVDTVIKQEPMMQGVPVDSENTEDSREMVIQQDLIKQGVPVDSEDVKDSVDTVIQNELVKQGVPVDLEDTEEFMDTVIQEEWMKLGVPVNLEDMEDSVDRQEPMKQKDPVDSEDVENSVDTVIQEEPMKQGSPVHLEETEDSVHVEIQEDPVNRSDPMNQSDLVNPVVQEALPFFSEDADHNVQLSPSIISYINAREMKLMKKFEQLLEETAQGLKADIRGQGNTLEMLKEQIRMMQDAKFQMQPTTSCHAVSPESQDWEVVSQKHTGQVKRSLPLVKEAKRFCDSALPYSLTSSKELEESSAQPQTSVPGQLTTEQQPSGSHQNEDLKHQNDESASFLSEEYRGSVMDQPPLVQSPSSETIFSTSFPLSPVSYESDLSTLETLRDPILWQQLPDPPELISSVNTLLPDRMPMLNGQGAWNQMEARDLLGLVDLQDPDPYPPNRESYFMTVEESDLIEHEYQP